MTYIFAAISVFFFWGECSDAKDYHLITLQPGTLARSTQGYEAFTLKIMQEAQLMWTAWKCESERSLAFISTSPAADLLSYVPDCAPASLTPNPQHLNFSFSCLCSLCAYQEILLLFLLHSSGSSARFSLFWLRIVSFFAFPRFRFSSHPDNKLQCIRSLSVLDNCLCCREK